MTHLLTRSTCGSSWTVESVSAARLGVVCDSSGARVPSSFLDSQAADCAIHGNEASIVAGVSRTPGRISRANARVGGKARLSASKVRLALASVGASRRIVARQVALLGREGSRGDVEVRDEAL